MPLAVRLWGRWTGKGPEFVKGSYHLKFGMYLNIIGLLYLAFACITFNFPSVHPINASNMNYTSAAVGACALIAALTWFLGGNKKFSGPQAGTFYHGGILTVAPTDSVDGSVQAVKLDHDIDGKIHPE